MRRNITACFRTRKSFLCIESLINSVLGFLFKSNESTSIEPHWPQAVTVRGFSPTAPFSFAHLSPYCGFLAAILFGIGVITIGLVQPDYLPLADTVSKMGREGRPFAMAINVILMLTGILIAIFALGLPRSQRFHRSTCNYLALFGIFGLAGSGFLPCDEICAGNSMANITHTLPVAIGFASLQLALLQITNMDPGDQFWSGIPKSSRFLFWAGSLALVIFMLGRWQLVPQLDSYAGLSEKIYLAFFFAFVLMLAKRLYLRSKSATKP